MKRLDVAVCDVPELVSACCVLHNVCEIHGDHFNVEWLDGVDRNDRISANATSTHAGENSTDIRSALMAYFNRVLLTCIIYVYSFGMYILLA